MQNTPTNADLKSLPARAARLVRLSVLGVGFGVLAASCWSLIAIEDGFKSDYAAAFSKPSALARVAEEVARDGSTSIASQSTLQASPTPIARSEDFWLGHAANRPGVPVSLDAPVTVGDSLTISFNGRSQSFEVTGVRPGHISNEKTLRAASGEGELHTTQIVEITGSLPAVVSEAAQSSETRLRLLIQVTTPLQPANPKSLQQRQL
ncbi:MAG: hypothetical protein AAFO75_01840 [Pseudomonadota bacterium]